MSNQKKKNLEKAPKWFNYFFYLSRMNKMDAILFLTSIVFASKLNRVLLKKLCSKFNLTHHNFGYFLPSLIEIF